MRVRDSLSVHTTTVDYTDQFFYTYDNALSKYVYKSREEDAVTVNGANMDIEPRVSVVVPRGVKPVEHNLFGVKTGTAVEFQPYIQRNRTLDLASPHQNVKMGFKTDDLEVFAGNGAFVEIDGTVHSDTRFHDNYEVVVDLGALLGVSAVVLMSKTLSLSQYTKRFMFKAVGTLLPFTSNPTNYWVGLIIRTDHLGTVDTANDILTYGISARVTLGSGFASWVLPPVPLPGYSSEDDTDSISVCEESLDGWERV